MTSLHTLLEGMLCYDQCKLDAAVLEIQKQLAETEPHLAKHQRYPPFTSDGEDVSDKADTRLATLVARLLSVYPSMAAVPSGRDGSLPLHVAARLGQLSLCRLLHEAHPPAAATPNRKGKIPLHYAARQGSVPIVHFLVGCHAGTASRPTCASSGAGKLPLHFAAGEGHVGVCRLLLAAHPDGALFRSAKGKLAADVAARSGHMEVARMLNEFVCGQEQKHQQRTAAVGAVDSTEEKEKVAGALMKLSDLQGDNNPEGGAGLDWSSLSHSHGFARNNDEGEHGKMPGNESDLDEMNREVYMRWKSRRLKEELANSSLPAKKRLRFHSNSHSEDVAEVMGKEPFLERPRALESSDGVLQDPGKNSLYLEKDPRSQSYPSTTHWHEWSSSRGSVPQSSKTPGSLIDRPKEFESWGVADTTSPSSRIAGRSPFLNTYPQQCSSVGKSSYGPHSPPPPLQSGLRHTADTSNLSPSFQSTTCDGRWIHHASSLFNVPEPRIVVNNDADGVPRRYYLMYAAAVMKAETACRCMKSMSVGQ